MKILIMDSLPATLGGLDKYLPGLSVDIVHDFPVFEEKVKTGTYECLILDVSEMEGSAIQTIQTIRIANKQSGLIITSFRNSLQERVDAITTGADDFLTKPFDISELAARIIALVRRINPLDQQDLVYQEIRVNVQAKTVFINDQRLDLTKKELELLMYFIEHKNSVVKKDNLISYLSGQLKDFKSNTDVIYAHVKNLKKKLTDAGCKTYLKTIYGIGYRWEDL